MSDQHHDINYVELPTADIDAIKTFYTSAFGWQFEDYGPDYSSFNSGQLNGGFYRAPLSASTENGSVLIVIFSKDLEASLASVKDSGGNITRDIFSFPGGRRFHFQDPNNNELAVWSDT